MNSFIVTAENAGLRLDKIIVGFMPDISRSLVQKLIEDGNVTVNGDVASKNAKPSEGDEISVTVPQPRELSAEPQDIPLDIRYEDSDLLVVNKARGMVVHPAAGNYNGTLVNALLYHCGDSLSGINGVIRPGIVHRIDKDTSGLLIVAKNDFAHVSLAEQIKQHSFDREYKAVICGHLREKIGTVNAPIGRSDKDRKKMCVTAKNSREAITHYEVIDEYQGFSFVSLKLETGRTHQIRVHMSYLGHPVAGDTVYGSKTPALPGGQCLHAGLIGFIHPRTGNHMTVTSELPQYFNDFLHKLDSIG